VVLTGGEPLHHDLNALCTALTAASQELPRGPLPLHLETSGVDPLSGQFDWITLSPKRHRPPRPELLQVCHELKAVVHDEEDLAFALAMAAAAGQRQGDPGPALLLQPGWDDEQGLELAIAHARHHPEWRLSLQGHKWLQIR